MKGARIKPCCLFLLGGERRPPVVLGRPEQQRGHRRQDAQVLLRPTAQPHADARDHGHRGVPPPHSECLPFRAFVVFWMSVASGFLCFLLESLRSRASSTSRALVFRPQRGAPSFTVALSVASIFHFDCFHLLSIWPLRRRYLRTFQALADLPPWRLVFRRLHRALSSIVYELF